MRLQEVLQLAKELSPVDKVRLIQQLTPDLEKELAYRKPQPKKSLWGLCKNSGTAPSIQEIMHSRREEWSNFPREDI